MSHINGDEFDTIVELIIAVVFMCFGAWAMASMVANLSVRVNDLGIKRDKIEMTSSQHESEDPFYFTGYQAYMFAWHMDDMSYEKLAWVSNEDARLNSNDKDHVELGILDKDGNMISQFYTWRNQMITGAGMGKDRSVKKVLNNTVNGNQSQLVQLYRGKLIKTIPGGSSGRLMYHLELTGDYTTGNDLGSDSNTGGKMYRWVMVPTLH